MSQSGIYEIRHIATGRVYIGSAKDFDSRWSVHRSSLRRGVSRCTILQRAWSKHGEYAFEFRRLLICAPKDLLFYEQRCIDAFSPAFNAYKVAGSPIGTKWTDEQRRRLSEIRKAQPKRVITPEQRAAMNAGRVGIKLSAEHRAKIGESARGRTHTDETRARMSAAQKGRVVSDEARAKQAAALTGRKHTDEHKAKIAAAMRGRPKSPETRAKMSAAKRAAAAAKKASAMNGS